MTVLERRLLAASLLFALLTISVITGRAIFAAPRPCGLWKLLRRQ